MIRKALLLTYVLLFSAYYSKAQTVTFPKNDISDQRQDVYAFIHSKIYVDDAVVLTDATLIIKKGIIQAVGNNLNIPAEATIIDCSGKWIYPSFIDAESDYGMPPVGRGGGTYYNFEMESKKKGPFAWNQAIQPENSAMQMFSSVPALAADMRKAGFGAVMSHYHDGIARGSSVLVALGDEKNQVNVLKAPVAAHYSFSKGSSTQSYPNSMMGSVALLRQTYYDAIWYKGNAGKSEFNASLEAFDKLQSLPQVFEANDKFSIIRAGGIAKEFNTEYIMLGGGDEYQKIEEVKNAAKKIIVPLNFPAGYDIEDPLDAKLVSLAELKHWEMAAANPGILAKAGIELMLTAAKLKSKSDFLPNLRKAVSYGLSENDALRALTVNPAKALKINNIVGSLKSNLLANFIICDGNIFGADAQIVENWVQGKKYLLQNHDEKDLRGTYQTKIGAESFTLNITGKRYTPDYQIVYADSLKASPKVTRADKQLSIKFTHPKNKSEDYRIAAYLDGENLKGTAEDNFGKSISFEAIKTNTPIAAAKVDSSQVKVLEIGQMIYPFTAFGNFQKPVSENFIIKNATVWTNESQGIVTNTDVIVEQGKIKKIGKNLSATGLKVIDGTGKHLSSGIIDEHSHIALLSINEGGQSVSAEVRTADVLDDADIDIYRQLAGGTTAAQLLHGSANSIGGQSTLIKFKWGESAENLKIAGADPFIKFALGENVTRKAAQGSASSANPRYPQSRMGVEQVMMDAFSRAQAYDKEWKAYNALKNKDQAVAPRKDLELEALAEIINKKRFITCHSYVQSEINMMMKVAEAFNFRINTFTHILEGYKLANTMAKHGAGGSTFSDWWAYKMEVRDAIPYNAALMHKAGVTVAINSDDAEMARRLNQEAAKAIRYGGLSEEEAWKTITLNPAKLLHLDDRMGSIKVGKDADLVLWNTNPLSVYAKPERTIIDGATYFDSKADEQKQLWLAAERARIIQKMLASKGGSSEAKQKPTGPKAQVESCEDDRSGF